MSGYYSGLFSTQIAVFPTWAQAMTFATKSTRREMFRKATVKRQPFGQKHWTVTWKPMYTVNNLSKGLSRW